NIAVQGPQSRDIVSAAVSTTTSRPVSELRWFSFTTGTVPGGAEVLVSRTGYSGELGYELWCRPEDGPAVWDAVFDKGSAHGLLPLGLDALDILRIEAGLIFKGYEYEGNEDPFEAGIGFTVPRQKADDFVGKDALDERRQNPKESLVGLEVDDPEPMAHGDTVLAGGEAVGIVTSGALSPSLSKNLALARVKEANTTHGERLAVRREGGDSTAAANVVRFPFYDPDKARPRS
ncbi:MAG: aminomethyltransferase family protein, partial [Acidimicrobiales bacterium]